MSRRRSQASASSVVPSAFDDLDNRTVFAIYLRIPHFDTSPLGRRDFQMRDGPLDKLGVTHDLGIENLGDWTVLLGVSRQIGESCFVEVGHFGAQCKSRSADSKSFALRFKSDGRLGAECCRCESGSLQAKGERHSEATSMCCGDQLFGIGAFLVLKARFERIRRFREHSGIGGKIAATVAAHAAPNRCRLADHGSLLRALALQYHRLDHKAVLSPVRFTLEGCQSGVKRSY